MESAPAVIGVDWGTTNFRAYLLSTDGRVLDEFSQEGQGVKAIAARQPNEVDATNQKQWRQTEFQGVLRSALQNWAMYGDIPIVMSGMIGSSIGWQEVTYVATPASIKRVAASMYEFKFEGRRAFIAPGVSCQDDVNNAPDVMRGEETQIFGALATLSWKTSDDDTPFDTICLPGIHCKWSTVKDNTITGFQTFMTGEVYDVMRTQSILAPSFAKDATGKPNPLNLSAFIKGLERSRKDDGKALLSSIFSARTENLFDNIPSTSVESYLSGILIGHEVVSTLSKMRPMRPVALIGAPELTERYGLALHHFGVSSRVIGSGAPAGLALLAQAAGITAVCPNEPNFPVVEDVVQSTASMISPFRKAMQTPLIGILRGVDPQDVIGLGEAIVSSGITMLVIPLARTTSSGSSSAMECISRLASNNWGGNAPIIGAGGIQSSAQIRDVYDAGGRLFVTSRADTALLRTVKELGNAFCISAFTNEQEASNMVAAGVDALKLFPASMVSNAPTIDAIKRVTGNNPGTTVFVEGVSPKDDELKEYWEYGARGFMLGGSLYYPTRDISETAEAAALAVQRVTQIQKEMFV